MSTPSTLRSIVVGTAGHIDHGKSALVLALTGTDPDRLKEEKARGITIDLGFAHTTIDGMRAAFVDVPGHERFVKNMLAGVGGIDLVLFVIAADESVMPQTREHFEICRLLHVRRGVIALTKIDLADEDMRELARLETRELVAGSFLEDAPIVPVSALTGEGLDRLRQEIAGAAGAVPPRRGGTVARLPIDRVFSMKGFGTVVTGTIASGRIAVDDELVLLPSGRPVKVRGVQVHGAKEGSAAAGQRSAVNLQGVEVGEVARGETLATAGAIEVTRVVDASIALLAGAKPLKHGARVRFHQGTSEILARVTIVGPPRQPGGGQQGDAIEPGRRAYVRLRLESPAALARGDRYIVRAYSPPATIGGGQILDPRPPRGAVRNASALDRCARLEPDPAADRASTELAALRVMIERAGAAGLPVSDLTRRASVDPADAASRIEALARDASAIRVGDVLVAPAVIDALQRGVVDLLAAHHKAQPLSAGVPREEARERLFRRGAAAVFDQAVGALAARGTIVARDRLALASHRVELSPEEERARAALDRAFAAAGLTPPDAGAVAASAGLSAAVADRMLALLQRQKVLVKVDTLVFHEQTLAKLKQDVATLKTAGGGQARIDVGTFKERFGVSRKFAIPLLEYLDRERVTRRIGDARVVL